MGLGRRPASPLTSWERVWLRRGRLRKIERGALARKLPIAFGRCLSTRVSPVGTLRKVTVAIEQGPRAGAAGWRWRGSLVVEHGFAWRLDGEGVARPRGSQAPVAD